MFESDDQKLCERLIRIGQPVVKIGRLGTISVDLTERTVEAIQNVRHALDIAERLAGVVFNPYVRRGFGQKLKGLLLRTAA